MSITLTAAFVLIFRLSGITIPHSAKNSIPMRVYSSILFVASACVCALLPLTGTSKCVANERPNVIVILADDLGYADVGFHEVTSEDVSTPNLDRLAASGVVFRNAYAASPVCSNSRLALSTGRYPQRWGAYYYGQGGLPTAERTIAEMMRDTGYRTMKVGKTHLNNGPKQEPTKHGFEHSLAFTHHSWHYHMVSEKDVAAYERRSPGSAARSRQAPFGPLIRDGKTKESYENTTTTEVFGRESVEFVQQKSDKPFYLQLEFNAVHTPLTHAPEQLREKYGIPSLPFDRNADRWEYPIWDPVTQPDFNEWYEQTCHLGIADPYGRRIYLAHLELMDTVIGELIDALEAKGLRENTLIFFSSDNGGSNQSYANNGDINAYKYCLMDGGIKVPMILSWPARLPRNASEDAVVTHRDLFPSLADVLDQESHLEFDGKSVMPLLDGSVEMLHEEALFWDCGTKNATWITMDGDWKLVYREQERDYLVYELDAEGLVKTNFRKLPVPAGMRLYNLADDPGELDDLASRFPDRVELMQRAREQWRSQMAAPISGRKAE
ncbi:MAG: sulfatase-like hydrolase/transferase [Planctomycetota bacterium]